MQLTAHSAARASVRGSLAFVTVAALALGLAACSGSDDPVPTPTVTVDPNIDADKNAAPEPVVPIVWPLTGVAVEEVPARPAIAVKVENTAAARPQSGLEDADIVWETIVEYEVSRFIAVFNSNLPKEVGPVRSARPVDLRVVTPAAALDSIHGLEGWRALRKAFIPALLPADFSARIRRFEERPPRALPERLAPFVLGWPIGESEELWVVPLPGHAEGQIGLFVQTEQDWTLLASDAAWAPEA